MMNTKLVIGLLIVGLTLFGIAHASLNVGFANIPDGGRLSIQSYGPGISPFYGQHVTSVSYRQPGYSSGYFRDTTSGLTYGGFTSREFSGGYSGYTYPNGRSVGTVAWKGSGTSGTLSQYNYPTGNGYYSTRYAGQASIGSGVYNTYQYRQPTIWGNSYGRPVTYGYDMLGSSGY